MSSLAGHIYYKRAGDAFMGRETSPFFLVEQISEMGHARKKEQ